MSSDFMDPLPSAQQQQLPPQVLHDTSQVIDNASQNIDTSSHSHQLYSNNGELQQNYYQGMD